jgi:hypothetical protein
MRSVLAACAMVVALASTHSAAGSGAVRPWVLTLDADKGITYFDERGRQLSRTRLQSPSKAADCLDIELGDFIPGNGWPELILLRDGYWFETFPLPRPGQQAVKRLDYHRFQPVSGWNGVGVALVNYPADPAKLALLVPSRHADSGELNRLFLYETLNPAERSQVRVMSIQADWPEVGGQIRMAALGLNCRRANLVVLSQDNRLWLGSLNAAGAVQWLVRQLEIPKGVDVRRLQLVADQLYLLDGAKRIHVWQWDGDQLKPAGKPVRLDLGLEIRSFIPLLR